MPVPIYSVLVKVATATTYGVVAVRQIPNDFQVRVPARNLNLFALFLNDSIHSRGDLDEFISGEFFGRNSQKNGPSGAGYSIRAAKRP